MRFADIKGQEAVKKALTGMCDSGRVAHALMLHEDEGCGGLALALAYVQYLNCENKHDGDSCGTCPSCHKMGNLVHPDVLFVFPTNSGSKADSSKKPTSATYLPYWRELVLSNPYFTENQLSSAIGIEGKAGAISVAEAKYILDTLALSPVENGYRAVIIWQPEKMNKETSNRLLKTIEEPSEKTVFLFITQHPESVLQTISSRCQHLRVAPVPMNVPSEEQLEYKVLFQELMSGIAAKDLASVLEFSEKLAALGSRDKQKAFCIFAEDCIRKLFLYRSGVPETARVEAGDETFYASLAAKCGPDFCAVAARQLDISVGLIDRNVNAKVLFCDLVDRMFLSF